MRTVLFSNLLLLVLSAILLSQPALAQEAQIRQNLQKNIPTLPDIESVQPTPAKGIYELVLEGNQVLYTTADGAYLIQGELINSATRKNLTQERTQALETIPFTQLPLQDSIQIVRGDGKRKMAVFADPNCGFCKRFESALESVDNVTIYLMLYPILGPDSMTKSRSVWCAKDPAEVWEDWMLNAQPIPETECNDTATLQRNIEFGRQNSISGTPTIFFENGTRVPGAISTEEIEQLLTQASQS